MLTLWQRSIHFNIQPAHLQCVWRRDLPVDVCLIRLHFLRDWKLCQYIWLERVCSLPAWGLPECAGEKRVRGVRRRLLHQRNREHCLPWMPSSILFDGARHSRLRCLRVRSVPDYGSFDSVHELLLGFVFSACGYEMHILSRC